MARNTLTTEDRALLDRVVETIYTNPFTLTREALRDKFPAPVPADDHHFAAIAPPLEGVMERLAGRGIRKLADVDGRDRERLCHAWLFLAYHRCVGALDALIEAQVAAPEEELAVPFANETIDGLSRRGLSRAEAVRYFALFFQLRRAYYFIDRALVGPSRCMAELRRALWNCVFTEDARLYDAYLWNRMEDFSTLLLGETGTGKGAAAAAVGRSGFIPFDPKTGRFAERFTATFTAANLEQFPEGVLESELFGHRKGAFTGATDRHRGLFERCSPFGSLFLDEIGEASVSIQIKLLKVLQERGFTPVGSRQEQRFSGRLIAATNRTLGELREGGFRDDFYYRLSSQVVTVPPLRRRIEESAEELPRLVELLLARTLGEPHPELTERVLAVVRRDIPDDYPWPGNVRELEQAVRRVLLAQRCRPESSGSGEGAWSARMEEGALTAQQLLAEYCAMLHRRFGTYEEVARRTELDRRTVKKYVQMGTL